MQRFSKYRQAILNCLRETDSHPTAEWIFDRLKAEYPQLSLGTVYRNLAQLKEAGMIRSMGVEAGEEHFDGNTSAHPHAVCVFCGAIIDLEEPTAFTDMVDKVRSATGYHITELQFRGICPACEKKDSDLTKGEE